MVNGIVVSEFQSRARAEVALTMLGNELEGVYDPQRHVYVYRRGDIERTLAIVDAGVRYNLVISMVGVA